ncbi:MAG TPA: SpoIID/LytB domain-containing protein [Anaeromyxobacteraceae bacterium]|nr:SpoIID/LytB domain-containing protein [Anaeromyxobacteraceae bacterium]
MRAASRRALAVALGLAALAAAPARAEELIRVVVAEGLPRVALSGPGLALREPDEDGPGRAVGGRVEIVPAPGGLSVGGDAVGGPAVLSAAGPIRLGDRLLAAVVQVEPGPGGLTVIEELPLDDYVAGVLSGELPQSFPPEAQKAQAVAARTYALVKKIEAEASGRGWHLGANVLSQVYAGAAPNPAARAAADATRGEVLVMGNEPVEAFFHSSCGGRTERGLDALGRDLPYLVSVKCGRCNAAPGARWTLALGGAELARATGLPGKVTAVRVTERTGSGRVARVELVAGGRAVPLTAADLRQRVGYARLPSLAFEVKEHRGTFTFTGRGQGHGAGLCQWGAAGLAREGKGYREILAHYYPGTDVVKMY